MQGFSGHPFERRRVAGGRPEFELDVAGRAQLQQVVVAAVEQFQPRHRLGVAAIEALRETEDSRERTHGAPRTARQIAKAVVATLRRRLAMVASDQRDRFDFVRFEAS